MTVWFDRVVTGGILFLILFTPFAFGSVHPWAFGLMEAMIFLLVAVWMAKILYVSREHGAGSREPGAESGEQGAGAFRPPAFQVRLPYLVLPLALFIGFVLLQLAPLPPALLRIISPATYEVYTQSLPGWPARMPYDDLFTQSPAPGSRNEASQAIFLPTPEEVSKGERVPFSAPSADTGAALSVTGSVLPAPGSAPSAPSSTLHALGSLLPETWFPLSIAPALTRTDLLKFVAYAALFFLVLLYPFSAKQSATGNRRSAISSRTSAVSSRHSERSAQNSFAPRADGRFLRWLLLVVLLAGFAVAAVGFAQRFAWNGKILWFFVPYDWGDSTTGEIPRMSGSFINPNHFANYLALILPLSLACAISRWPVLHERLRAPIRIFSAFTAVLLCSGILLSLSRSGWISALAGVAVFLWLFPRRIDGGNPEPAGNQRTVAGSETTRAWVKNYGWSVTRNSLIIVIVLIMMSLMLIGPSGRGQVDARLGESVAADSGLWGRAIIWRDTLGMVRDFPLFGVGLGSWPELFPRYRQAPWSGDFYREAHNDYMELWAETGILGIGLLGWFFFYVIRVMFRGLTNVGPQARPLVAALCAVLGVMAFHELFDFNLQIPANAFLFTLLMALGLRIAGQANSDQRSAISAQHSEFSNWQFAVTNQKAVFQPAAIGLIALVLTGFALGQDQVPYPHNLYQRYSVAEAKKFLLAHPANALSHISVLASRESRIPLPAQQRLLAASLWLEPTNPHIRDHYASTLMRMGNTTEGLNQITRSISDAPAFSSHHYLTDSLLPWLSKEEQSAVEQGFRQALARSHPGALESFAAFYRRLGRSSEQAQLFEDAARRESDGEKKLDFLLKAGIAYTKAKEEKNAERVLSLAAAVMPHDSRPYHHLMTSIHGPRKELAKARALVSNGISRGAPPLLLYLSFAQAAGTAGSVEDRATALEQAKTFIEKAAKDGQDSYSLYLLLADAARQAAARGEAKSALLAALDLRPRSAPTLLRLADLYLEDNEFDHAALFYRRLAVITPTSADVHYRLGLAEEGRYRFAAAKMAYARATELAPQNETYRQRHGAFRARLEQNGR